MTTKRPAAFAVIFLLANTCGAAGADSDWKTVELNGGITMDVPSVVDNYLPSAKDAKSGELAQFFVNSPADGELDCLFSRYAYRVTPRAGWIDKLAGDDRNVLCTMGDNHTDTEVGESESLSVSGFPAGRCAAAYTVPGDKSPGQLTADMTVAAPGAVYSLHCVVFEETQDDAVESWLDQWKDIVQHVQQSIHLPHGA